MKLNKLQNSVARICPNCKYILKNFEEDYLAIGPPFVECSNCSRIVVLGYISEWELLDSYDRVYRIFTHICTSFFWSISFAVLLCCIPLTINYFNDTPFFSNEAFKNIVIFSCVISALIVFGVRSYSFYRVLMESKKRMTNLGYLKSLKEHGFLKMKKKAIEKEFAQES